MKERTTMIGALLLGLVAVLAVACSDGDNGAPVELTPAPAASPTATQTATPVETPTAAAGEISDELAEQLAEIDRLVSELRGISQPGAVPFEFLDQDELREFLKEELTEPESVEAIELAEKTYKLLGLIDQDTDLGEEFSSLLNSQVLGAYDDEDEQFVILQTDGEFGTLEEITYAHEYTHRLQDAEFDLTAMLDAVEGDDDAALALSALVEGDATTTQSLYFLRHIGLGAATALLEDFEEAQAAAEAIPFILRTSLEFPYTAGTEFVAQLNALGGFTRVDGAYANPPATSEQIMHPAKYVRGEAALDVTVTTGLLGDEWEVLDENTLGEFFVQAWLEALGAGRRNASVAAAGWGGDAVVLFEQADGGLAFAAILAWDDPEVDSAEFAETLSSVLDASQEFERLGTGIPQALVTWDGPGGVLGMARYVHPDHGGAIAVVVTPEINQTIAALGVLIGQ